MTCIFELLVGFKPSQKLHGFAVGLHGTLRFVPFLKVDFVFSFEIYLKSLDCWVMLYHVKREQSP